MIDEKKVEEGIRLILEGSGEDITRPGLVETPQRIANMYKEIYGGMDQDASVHLEKTFPAINNELVLEKDITFYSTCEHHLLPFYGKAHIAYIPDDTQMLLDTFGSAKNYRDDIPQSHARSLLQSSYEIFVDLIDESGAIATIATILATNGISIKNIGIVHNREFQEGVLHIEFYDEESAEKATELLAKYHYVIHLRK